MKSQKNFAISFIFAGLFLMVCIITAMAQAQEIAIGSFSHQDIERIGQKIFLNECSAKDENLISWNRGENFLSLGIGHFIWHPAGSQEIFEESFVHFLSYAKDSGETIPAWLDTEPFPTYPWRSREEFLQSQTDPKVIELKNFLIRTKTLQAAFIIKRFQQALPKILDFVAPENRPGLIAKINRVASTPEGVFALVDYVNFKGLGTSLQERYQGQGWGLLQVLERMRGPKEAADALAEFAWTADEVLTGRVNNAPVERNEERWLAGWRNRIYRYLE